MAIVTAISSKTQSRTAMKKVIDYVSQDKKTMFSDTISNQNYKLISGQNCVAENAYNEFMLTKAQYAKESGVYYRHFVQSFKPDENATPNQIHKIGIELAKYFEGFEVLVATHIDADHHHNHLIVNSVNAETGLKIQCNEKNLNELRDLSDEICKAYGLEILKPYESPNVSGINTREYRSALKGESQKFKLINAIDKAMEVSKTKEQFIGNMKKLNFDVKWIDHYKYITYTTPEGIKFRDNKLHDEKYLKERMEQNFHVRYEQTQGIKQSNQRDAKTLRTASDGYSERTVGQYGSVSDRDRQISGGIQQPYFGIADLEEYIGGTGRGDERKLSENSLYNNYKQGPDGAFDRQPDTDFEGELCEYDDESESEGFVPDQNQAQMGNGGNIDLCDVLYLAKSIEDFVSPPESKEDKKQKAKWKVKTRNDKKISQRNKGGYEMKF